MILQGEPLCRECLRGDHLTLATEVDHIVPMRQGGARLDRANLQPLCGNCHRRKTRAETHGQTNEPSQDPPPPVGGINSLQRDAAVPARANVKKIAGFEKGEFHDQS
jgi:hypothetical protein